MCARFNLTIGKALDRDGRGGYYQWLGENGCVVKVVESADIPGLRLKTLRIAIKGCYDNAARVARKHPGIKIVIGQAWSGIMPVDHAWNVTADGVFFDATAEKLRSRGLGNELTEYYAVKTMTLDEYEELMEVSKSGAPLLTLYYE